jgi:hypothetical protein
MYTGRIDETVWMKRLDQSRSNTWRGMLKAFPEDMYMFHVRNAPCMTYITDDNHLWV